MNPYMKKYEKEIMEIIETCHRDAEIGYGPAVSGNVSYRVDEDIVLITPTKTPKRLMRPEDICVLNMAGEPLYLRRARSRRARLSCTCMCSANARISTR